MLSKSVDLRSCIRRLRIGYPRLDRATRGPLLSLPLPPPIDSYRSFSASVALNGQDAEQDRGKGQGDTRASADVSVARGQQR